MTWGIFIIVSMLPTVDITVESWYSVKSYDVTILQDFSEYRLILRL
jgi:hypothetical protein